MDMAKHGKKIRDHLWGPTGSIILHIFIVILLINLIIPEKREPDDEAQPIIDRSDSLPAFTPRPDVEPLPPEDNPPMTPDLPPIVKELPPEAPNIRDINPTPVNMPYTSPIKVPVVTSGGPRTSKKARDDALDKFSDGLGKYTEPAVIRALEWLKKHQVKTGERKGAWQPGAKNSSEEQYAAVTGLGLLAFLAHGETLGSEEYGDTVKMAIKYLQKGQNEHGPDGAFCKLNQQGVYAHAIASYAISEAFALTRVPDLKDVMENAVRLIVDGQQQGGGWDYGYAKSARRDTSVASWQVQALKAAYLAGCDVEGVKEAINKSAIDLKKSYLKDSHTFSYTDGEPHSGTTAMAVLCLQMIGHGKDDVVFEALREMDDEECSWQTNEKWAMYKWYYLTQAKFHARGRRWERWNRDFVKAYVGNQAKDGHWDPPVKGKGHGDAAFGKAFPTALGALTLQVYYRFLPSYRGDATKKIEVKSDLDGDEEIDINVI